MNQSLILFAYITLKAYLKDLPLLTDELRHIEFFKEVIQRVPERLSWLSIPLLIWAHIVISGSWY